MHLFETPFSRDTLVRIIMSLCVRIDFTHGFPLAAGGRTPVKFDLAPLFADFIATHEVTEQLFHLLSPDERRTVRLITGPATGAETMAARLADAINTTGGNTHWCTVDIKIPRHRLTGTYAWSPTFRERCLSMVTAKKPVILVDDVITTGYSAAVALNSPALQPYRGQLLACLCVINRGNNPAIRSLFTLADFIPAIAARTGRSECEVRVLLGLPPVVESAGNTAKPTA